MRFSLVNILKTDAEARKSRSTTFLGAKQVSNTAEMPLGVREPCITGNYMRSYKVAEKKSPQLSFFIIEQPRENVSVLFHCFE